MAAKVPPTLLWLILSRAARSLRRLKWCLSSFFEWICCFFSFHLSLSRGCFFSFHVHLFFELLLLFSCTSIPLAFFFSFHISDTDTNQSFLSIASFVLLCSDICRKVQCRNLITWLLLYLSWIVNRVQPEKRAFPVSFSRCIFYFALWTVYYLLSCIAYKSSIHIFCLIALIYAFLFGTFF